MEPGGQRDSRDLTDLYLCCSTFVFVLQYICICAAVHLYLCCSTFVSLDLYTYIRASRGHFQTESLDRDFKKAFSDIELRQGLPEDMLGVQTGH